MVEFAYNNKKIQALAPLLLNLIAAINAIFFIN